MIKLSIPDRVGTYLRTQLLKSKNKNVREIVKGKKRKLVTLHCKCIDNEGSSFYFMPFFEASMKINMLLNLHLKSTCRALAI